MATIRQGGSLQAAGHCFATQERHSRRAPDIGSQDVGFARPAGDITFQEGTELLGLFCSRCVPDPTASISPAASDPIRLGRLGLTGDLPERRVGSVRFRPMARTRNRISPGPGWSSLTSTRTKRFKYDCFAHILYKSPASPDAP